MFPNKPVRSMSDCAKGGGATTERAATDARNVRGPPKKRCPTKSAKLWEETREVSAMTVCIDGSDLGHALPSIERDVK